MDVGTLVSGIDQEKKKTLDYSDTTFIGLQQCNINIVPVTPVVKKLPGTIYLPANYMSANQQRPQRDNVTM